MKPEEKSIQRARRKDSEDNRVEMIIIVSTEIIQYLELIAQEPGKLFNHFHAVLATGTIKKIKKGHEDIPDLYELHFEDALGVFKEVEKTKPGIRDESTR
jgi:hypothetical protein